MGIININKLNPHPKNDFYFTDITGDKYEEIKRSIDTYGIRDPLKVTTAYTIISGHQRYRIATDLGLIEVPVEIVDVDEWQAEYMLIAENIERRGEAESDPIKKGRIAGFLKEYWGVKNGGDRKADRQNGEVKNIQNIADFINEPKRNAERLLKLNSLIPQLQSLVSSGALGTTAAEQLSHLTEEEQQALFETLGNDVGDITVEESKMIRQEVQGLRDENKSLQDTIESLKNQSPRIVHKEVVREVVPDKVSNEMKKLKELYESSESERVRLEEYIKSDEYKLLDNERKMELQKQQEKLMKTKAHMDVYALRSKVNKFIVEAAPDIYLQTGMAILDENIKKELYESLASLKLYVSNLQDFLNGKVKPQTEIIDIN